MMKRFLLLLLCLGMLALPVLAAEGEGEQNPGGVCGETMLWELDGDTLTVFGQGAMEDFDMMAPWFDYRERITRVELMGVTYVGSFAFTDFDNITEADLGDALEELGQSAFSDCDGLTELTFPETFRVLGEESLSGCDNLTALHCSGKFPSFRQNCLWQTSVKIYFPAERPWSVELIAQLEEAFHGRIEFLDSLDPHGAGGFRPGGNHGGFHHGAGDHRLSHGNRDRSHCRSHHPAGNGTDHRACPPDGAHGAPNGETLPAGKEAGRLCVAGGADLPAGACVPGHPDAAPQKEEVRPEKIPGWKILPPLRDFPTKKGCTFSPALL